MPDDETPGVCRIAVNYAEYMDEDDDFDGLLDSGSERKTRACSSGAAESRAQRASARGAPRQAASRADRLRARTEQRHMDISSEEEEADDGSTSGEGGDADAAAARRLHLELNNGGRSTRRLRS